MTTSHSDTPSLEKTAAQFDSTLRTVCEAAVRLLHVDHSGLVIFDSDLKSGRVRAEFPDLGAVNEIIPIHGIDREERLAQLGQPIIDVDVDNSDILGAVKPILQRLGIKSIVIVPIQVNGKVLGSFSFDSLNSDRVLTDDDLEHCTTIAQFASAVIKNAYLMQEIRGQAERLEALTQAILAITRERERETLLKVIIQQAVNLLNGQGGGLYELNPQDKTLRVIADFNRSNHIGLVLKVGEGMAGRLLESNRSYDTTANYAEWAGKSPVYDDSQPFGSVLEVILTWQGTRTGVLYVDGEVGRLFTYFDADLLLRFAAAVSIALQHSNLTAKETYKSQSLHALAKATNDIVRRLTTSTPKERFTLIAQYAHQIVGAEACGIHLVNKPGWLTLVASHGHRPGGFKEGRQIEIRTGTGTGLTGHIAFEGKVFRACGTELSGHFAVANREPDTSASGKCRSLLAVPLKRSIEGVEQISGLLRISNKLSTTGAHELACFSEEDQAIAEIFAQATTVEIETAELLDQNRLREIEVEKSRRRYENLLKASNAVVGADSLEEGLKALASMLISQLGGKSFCRILLMDDNERFLRVMAAVQIKCDVDQFKWNPRLGDLIRIEKWKNLSRTLQVGRAAVMHVEDHRHHENLRRLSTWLDLKTHTDRPMTVQSLLSIPLKLGNRIVGLLNVGELREPARTTFSDEEQELAASISAQATILIDKARREKDIERRRELYSRLDDAIGEIRKERNTRELLVSIIHQTHSLFSCDVAGLIIQDSARRRLRLLDSTGADCDLEPNTLSELPGFLGNVVREEIADICFGDNERNTEEFFEVYKLSTILAAHVPLSIDSEAVLFVGDAKDNELGRADVEVLDRFAQQCAISFSKLLSREHLTSARDGAHIVAEAMALGDFPSALEEVVAGIRQCIDCSAVTLYRIDPRTKAVILPPALANVWHPQEARGSEPFGEHSAVTKMLNRGELHEAEDARNDSIMMGGFVEREGIVSSAAIPLVSQGETIGLLFVNYRHRHRFVEDDRKNIKLFAHQAAVAIRNALLYEESKILNRRTAALQAITLTGMAASIWGHTIEAIANRILLVAKKSLARLDESKGPLRKTLSGIAASANELIEMKVALPRSMMEGAGPQRVNTLVQKHIDLLRDHDETKQIDFDVNLGDTEKSTVTINKDWFNEVLRIFTRNAVQAVSGSPLKQITITTRRLANDVCMIEVRNSGPPVPLEDWSKIFEEPIVNSKTLNRKGMGLLAARLIVEEYGGAVHKLSNDDDRIALGFSLPLNRADVRDY